VDLNGDGNKDILSGSYSHQKQPMAGVFQVLWGEADGTFKPAEELTGTDGGPLVIQPYDDSAQGNRMTLETICTRPMAVDWDVDGDLDLVVGNFGGSFYVFLGEGEGLFNSQAQPLMSGDSPLKINGQHSDPFVVDWDADGDLDLLSGASQGGVQWAENIAGPGKVPELRPFTSMIESKSTIEIGQLLDESDLTGPTSSTRIWVDDVNSDGKPDILVGDNTRLITPVEGLSEEEYQEKNAAWKISLEQASEEFTAAMQAGETGDGKTENGQKSEQSGFSSWIKSLFGSSAEKVELTEAESQAKALATAQEKYQAVYQRQSEFMKAESTGYVWLYLQKASSGSRQVEKRSEVAISERAVQK
jgi:hypothetical protein